MPLNTAGLTSDLESLFAEPPATAAECAQAWADAAEAWASGIVPPSATVAAASVTLAGALTGAFATPAAAPLMDTAFLTFATAVGIGMAGYAPVPPVAPIGFAPQFAGPKPETHAAAAQQLASLLDVWMKTGTATLLVPPFTVLLWS
jgi:hypothetical protein